MSTKLTNESVALALGWKTQGERLIGSSKVPTKHKGWWMPDGTFYSYILAPEFTTSLDAIVAEVRSKPTHIQKRILQEIANEAEEKGLHMLMDPLTWCRATLLETANAG